MADVAPVAGTFDARVAISKGVKPIANGGRVLMANSWLELYDTKGNLVARGPLADVWAKKRPGTWGSGVSLWIGTDKFMISRGTTSATGLLVGGASAKVLSGRAFSREFLAALEAAGAHLGKRPG
jgi:hypothetical protein